MKSSKTPKPRVELSMAAAKRIETALLFARKKMIEHEEDNVAFWKIEEPREEITEAIRKSKLDRAIRAAKGGK